MKARAFITASVLWCLASVTQTFAADNVTRLSNVLYVQEQTVGVGSEATLTVWMKNDINAVGFQFDLCLPDGITLATSPDASVASGFIVNGNRHTLSAANMKSGDCRVLCYSLQNSTFQSASGSVAEVTVKVASTLPAGKYPVVLKNVELTDASGTTTRKLETVTTTLTVSKTQPVGIRDAQEPASADGNLYNVAGQKVPSLRPGQIGIKKGKKVLNANRRKP